MASSSDEAWKSDIEQSFLRNELTISGLPLSTNAPPLDAATDVARALGTTLGSSDVVQAHWMKSHLRNILNLILKFGTPTIRDHWILLKKRNKPDLRASDINVFWPSGTTVYINERLTRERLELLKAICAKLKSVPTALM